MRGNRLYSRILRLIGDIGGNMLPLGAMGIIIAAALIGGGVDMGRAYLVKNRLQAACDAAVLAGRRGVTTSSYDANAQAQASTYFSANFDNGNFGARSSNFTTSAADSGNIINGTASAVVDTTIMRIFGRQDFNLTATCQSSMGVGNSDVTMVLDTTGSMDWTLSGTSQTRIQALRAAMKNFYTTLATATAGSTARIRYGFVPYSSAVNVGRLLYNLNPAYLVDSWQIQSREAQYRTVTNSVFDHWGTAAGSTGSGASSTTYDNSSTQYSGPYADRTSCNSALPADTAWANNGSSFTTGPATSVNGSGQQVTTTTLNQPQVSTTYFCQRNNSGVRYIYSQLQYRTLYSYSYSTSDPVNTTTTTTVFDRFDYKPVTYDVSSYKAFNAVSTNTGSNGAAQSSTWAGCIEERASTAAASFSYSSLTGISPNAADLDIDSAPTASAGSKWAPMWPEVSYYRTNSSGYASLSYPTQYGGTMGVYCPQQARLLATMTQTAFDAYADSLVASGATYHDIGMVWGARTSSPSGIFAATVNDPPPNGGNVSRHLIFMTDGQMDTDPYIQSSWGLEYYDRRTTSDGSTDQDARHTSRYLALCEAVKAKGIRLWVIAFGSTLTTDLSTCASSASSYTASNAAQLNTAFQEIAKQVGELRVVQ